MFQGQDERSNWGQCGLREKAVGPDRLLCDHGQVTKTPLGLSVLFFFNLQSKDGSNLYLTELL